MRVKYTGDATVNVILRKGDILEPADEKHARYFLVHHADVFEGADPAASAISSEIKGAKAALENAQARLAGAEAPPEKKAEKSETKADKG